MVWEFSTDATKFFFPPADFNPFPAPVMLSCAALDTSSAGGLSGLRQGLSPVSTTVGDRGGEINGVGVGVSEGTQLSPTPVHDAERGRGDGEGGRRGASSKREIGAGAVDGEHLQRNDEGGGTSSETACARLAPRGQRRNNRKQSRDAGDGGGQSDVKNTKAIDGRNSLRPFVIDLKAEVKPILPYFDTDDAHS